ncbi:hypothetical protein CYJ79_05980 [Lactobacillus crispatus]|uniref:Uncharacterized protein n=1 Tax=Lactobacillus crispatus TaxID=47770 RepID=A0A2N5KY99_9LACO|nr:hypothetical protein [Lactobacillus crispatus]PLT11217.1 hypothetical protein CYJ79_05980 [Lactobacillus crispatus]
MKIINNSEFDKRDAKMSKDIRTLKELVECAENQGTITLDGVEYGASRAWVEVATLALRLSSEQEWFENNED